ncbi:MAG: hypothetical protein PHE06_13910 [Lachnospiraceae bacterium]|nr:hypothetical protein [Lachnospiraceae bacterium]
MLQFIMDQNLLLYVCGVACALGVVSQFLLKHLYGKLISETQGTREKGKFLQQLRLRFQNCTHLNEKVNDISSFTDRSILDYQFLKMNLHQWRRLGLESLAVCLICSGAGMWLLYRNGGVISLSTSYLRAGIWSLLLVGIAYGLTDNRYRHHSLQIRLMDYLENSGAVKDYSEVEFADPGQGGRASRGVPGKSSILQGMAGGASARNMQGMNTQGVSAQNMQSQNTQGAYAPGAQGMAASGPLENASLGATEAAASAASVAGRRSRRQMKEEAAMTRAQREKQELKDSLLRGSSGSGETAASDETLSRQEKNRDLLRQMDPKEKEQILRDVLMEFLA